MKPYHHLSEQERAILLHDLEKGLSLQTIASKLARHPSTLSRELSRNSMMKNGVINERIVTTGYGKSLPIADNDTPAGRQANRRVEITLQPLTQS